MTPEEFKNITICSFSKFSDSTLEHYIQEGNKFLSQGTTIDKEIIDIIDRLLSEQRNRGK